MYFLFDLWVFSSIFFCLFLVCTHGYPSSDVKVRKILSGVNSHLPPCGCGVSFAFASVLCIPTSLAGKLMVHHPVSTSRVIGGFQSWLFSWVLEMACRPSGLWIGAFIHWDILLDWIIDLITYQNMIPVLHLEDRLSWLWGTRAPLLFYHSFITFRTLSTDISILNGCWPRFGVPC